jgi:FAD/FMN-containing dehydrogenase
MAAGHCGPPGAGEAATKPIKTFGPPALDAFGPIPYCQLNSMLDAGFPRGAHNYWKSSFLDRLSDEAIDMMIECFAKCPTPMGSLSLEHFHGAVSRIGVADTAFPHRSDGYNLLVLSQWTDSAITDRCIAWARDSYTAMAPFMAKGRYANYLGDDEAGDAAAAAYGPNHRRLQQIKAKYDPTNFFHINQNIRPLA